MGYKFLVSSFAVLLATSAIPANATQLLVNGNFSAGLTGWTSYTTPNGTITETPSLPGAPVTPQVAAVKSFDVTGSGAQSALYLHAGVYLPPYGSTQEGGGVFQTFTSGAGLASFSASIAAWTRLSTSGGLLSVFLDDQLLDSFDFGSMLAGETRRSTLDFTTNLTAGSHVIKLQATRLFGPSNIADQYFDNVSLDGVAAAAPVPEPASWALMIGGFALLGAIVRRQRVAVSFV